jgi:hypothetical protein
MFIHKVPATGTKVTVSAGVRADHRGADHRNVDQGGQRYGFGAVEITVLGG